MNITFCGHSNYTSNFNDKKRLLDYLEDIIQGKEVDFYLGGYGNFDSFALKCVKLYKEVCEGAHSDLWKCTRFASDWSVSHSTSNCY